MKSTTAGILLAGLGLGGVALAGYAIHRSRKRSTGPVQGHFLAEAASARPAKLRVHRRKSMSIDERVGILRDTIHESVKDPEMRKLALHITRHCRDRDAACEAKSIYDWTKKHIRYTGDVGPHFHGRKGPREAIDVFQTAARTVEYGGGDCDDHTILNCTLAIHNGFACNARITSPTRGKEDDWGHVYGMAGFPKGDTRKLMAMDSTLPGNTWFGREAPYGKKKDYLV